MSELKGTHDKADIEFQVHSDYLDRKYLCTALESALQAHVKVIANKIHEDVVVSHTYIEQVPEGRFRAVAVCTLYKEDQ